MEKGLLIVISGPAGSGKGTVNARLLESEEFAFSVSATTRAPRPGEVDGKSYHFISRADFEARIAAGEMLEYTCYCENYYGTPLREALEVLESGRNLILEIEVEGALNVKRLYPDAVLIMLLPPSFAVQEARLRGRGTEEEAVIKRRMEAAKHELATANKYQYLVINDDVEQAVSRLQTILEAESLRYKRMETKFLEVMNYA